LTAAGNSSSRSTCITDCSATPRADAVVERIVPSVHGAGWTLASADHIWFTLTRLYNETAMHGNRSLRPLSYIIPEIVHGNVDWDVMRETRAHVPIENALFYGLYFIEWLASGSVPMDLLYEFHPCRNSRNGDWAGNSASCSGFWSRFHFNFHRNNSGYYQRSTNNAQQQHSSKRPR